MHEFSRGNETSYFLITKPEMNSLQIVLFIFQLYNFGEMALPYYDIS